MANGYLPQTDYGLLTWSQNLVMQLTTLGVSSGLTLAQISTYDDAVTLYDGALSQSTNPSTKGAAKSLAKKEAKRELINLTQKYVAIIQANPGTTDVMRQAMGITIRKSPTRTPVPGSCPVTEVKSINGRAVTYTVHAAGSLKRGKLPRTRGLIVYTAEGTLPSTLAGWSPQGIFSTTEFTLTFNQADTATTVYMSCQWFNDLGETGPASAPLESILAPTPLVPAVGDKIKMAA